MGCGTSAPADEKNPYLQKKSSAKPTDAEDNDQFSQDSMSTESVSETTSEEIQVRQILIRRFSNRQQTLAHSQHSLEHYRRSTFGIDDNDEYFQSEGEHSASGSVNLESGSHSLTHSLGERPHSLALPEEAPLSPSPRSRPALKHSETEEHDRSPRRKVVSFRRTPLQMDLAPGCAAPS